MLKIECLPECPYLSFKLNEVVLTCIPFVSICTSYNCVEFDSPIMNAFFFPKEARFFPMLDLYPIHCHAMKNDQFYL